MSSIDTIEEMIADRERKINRLKKEVSVLEEAKYEMLK